MVVTIRAKEVMDKNLLLLDASTSVSEAVKRMTEKNAWSLIVEKQNLPVGVVTDRDILRRCINKDLSPAKVKIEEIMSSPLITISPDTFAGEMMEKMVEHSIRRLFVVDNGKIIGRVTQTALFQNSLNLMLTLSSLRHQM